MSTRMVMHSRTWVKEAPARSDNVCTLLDPCESHGGKAPEGTVYGNGGWGDFRRFDNSYLDPINGCRVYWGSHGCALERGHEGHHEDDCCECDRHPYPKWPNTHLHCVAKYPFYGPDTNFYGEDADNEKDEVTDTWEAIYGSGESE